MTGFAGIHVAHTDPLHIYMIDNEVLSELKVAPQSFESWADGKEAVPFDEAPWSVCLRSSFPKLLYVPAGYTTRNLICSRGRKEIVDGAVANWLPFPARW